MLIDQVFKYPEWSIELRQIYDTFPELKIVFTGSSVMRFVITSYSIHYTKLYDYDLIFLQDNKTGDYESLTYGQVHQKVLDLAAGLHAMGLRAGERAAILSEGQSDWLISELAILYCGAINVPLSTKLEADDELSFRLKHSGSKIIFVSSVQLIKIRKLIDVITSYSIHYTKLYEAGALAS